MGALLTAAVGLAVTSGIALADAAGAADPDDRWESDIIGSNPAGEPFRLELPGEIQEFQVGSGPTLDSLMIRSGSYRRQVDSGTVFGWPDVSWSLEPGEFLVEILVGDGVPGIASIAAFTSEGRLLGPFGDPDLPHDPETQVLSAPFGHRIVGLTGRAVGRLDPWDLSGFITGLGIITEPVEVPASCEFSVTNNLDRVVTADAYLDLNELGPGGFPEALGAIQPGATETFAMPEGFVPAAPYVSVLVMTYVTEGGSAAFIDSGTEPCGSNLVLEADDLTPPADTTPPPAPGFVRPQTAYTPGPTPMVLVTWEPGGFVYDVKEYDVLVDGVRLPGSVASLGRYVPVEAGAAHEFQVVARDHAGNESAPSRAAWHRVEPVDTTPPRVPTDLSVVVDAEGHATMSWTYSTDNGRMSGYRIFRDGIEIGTAPYSRFRVLAPAPPGPHSYQVLARDLTGNESALSEPLVFEMGSVDLTRPSSPRELSASAGGQGVTLRWARSTDNVGVVEYGVFRNGEQIGTTADTEFVAAGLPAASHWFQVLARDAAGNESFKTRPVFVDTEPPTIPRDLTASLRRDRSLELTWSRSSDNVTGLGFDPAYRVLKNGVVVRKTCCGGYNETDLDEGSFWYQVVAVDAAGNESGRTAPVRVDVGPRDTQRPTAPRIVRVDVDVPFNDMTVSWEPSTDNVGVDFYRIFLNGQLAGADRSTTGVVLDLRAGTNWVQVAAVDFEGNQSAKSPPVEFEVTGNDFSPPSAPTNLAAAITDEGDVELTWDPASDNLGVTEYQVLRNGVEIGVTAYDVFVVPTPAVGSHWYQVRARDAAGNEGNKTPPVRVDIV